MYEPRGIAGVVTSLIIILILGAILLGGCGLITNGMAGMVDSVADNGASVVNTWTQESNATTRTRIEWGARVAIAKSSDATTVTVARVNADTTKKTDFTFLLFWATRFFLVSATICAFISGGLYVANRFAMVPVLVKRGGE